MSGICVIFIDMDPFPISQSTLPCQPMFGKIDKITFIQHADIS